MFSELGILANVVQHPRGDDPAFLNTAFSIQAARGLFIWFVAVLCAYPVALFYKQPEIMPLLVVAGLSEMVRGLTSTAAWTLTRHVNLKNITLLSVGAEVASFGVAIVWAVASPSAWALVARTVASAVVYAAGSHFIAKPFVRFGWDRTAARDILHFGGWISLSTAAYFLGGQGERLVLAKFVTPAELGCFSLAIMISSVPAGGIGQLVNQIFLPVISSSVRTSRMGTVRDFGRARRLFFAVALFAGVGFLSCGKPFVTLLLNPKYRMTGWMLQALGLRVALDLFAAPASSLILAYGQSKYSAAANTTRLVFMIGGIWCAFALFGLREAIYVLVVAQVLSYFPLIFGIGKLLPEVVWGEIRYYVLFLALLGLAAALPWPAMR
jgi:O-antigen/teichoic acid export membrane protein